MSTLNDDVHDSNDRARKGESDASGDDREEEHLSAMWLSVATTMAIWMSTDAVVDPSEARKSIPPPWLGGRTTCE